MHIYKQQMLKVRLTFSFASIEHAMTKRHEILSSIRLQLQLVLVACIVVPAAGCPPPYALLRSPSCF